MRVKGRTKAQRIWTLLNVQDAVKGHRSSKAHWPARLIHACMHAVSHGPMHPLWYTLPTLRVTAQLHMIVQWYCNRGLRSL